MSRDVWDAETYTTRTCTKMSSLNKITGNLDEMLSAFQIDLNAKISVREIVKQFNTSKARIKRLKRFALPLTKGFG